MRINPCHEISLSDYICCYDAKIFLKYFTHPLAHSKHKHFTSMITERILKFLQSELNDFLGKYDEKPSSEGWFDAFTSSEEPPQEPKTEEQKRRAYQKYRRNRRSQNRQSQEQKSSSSYSDSYSSSSSYSSYSNSSSSNPEAKYYQALEVMPGATYEEIKIAYRKAMKKYHPDRFAGDAQKQKYAEQLSQKINEAYDYFKKKYQG